ncbi:MAG: hypothetical protein Q4E05_05910 [Pseudoclavibacter sp.]|nr:hypothetical protein [Pseudoclavibacter sp.]
MLILPPLIDRPRAPLRLRRLPGGPARSRWTGTGLLARVVLAQATSLWLPFPSGAFGALAMHGLVRLGGGTLLWAILVHAIADFAVIYFLYG